MELTVDQVLERGVAAHREGKLQEAEGLYRAILKAQPKHADANHNLGVLAVGINQAEKALPYFKTALEANSKQGQYWLSYLNALIELGHIDLAKQVLKQGKGIGLKGEKVNQLEARLNNTGGRQEPSPKQIGNLLALYNQKNFRDALVQGQALAKKFPSSPSINSIIGAIHSGLGNHDEAIAYYGKALEITPDYAEAHNNLGNNLNKLGKFDRAITHFKKSLAIKPDFVAAYSGLGYAFQRLLGVEAAAFNFNRSIKLKPDYAMAYYNLGASLKKVDVFNYKEIVANYKKTILLVPNNSEAYNDLSNVMQDRGQFIETEAGYKRALAIKPGSAKLNYNFGVLLSDAKQYDMAIERYKKAANYDATYGMAISGIGHVLLKKGQHKEGLKNIRIGEGVIVFDINKGFSFKQEMLNAEV